MTVAGLQISAEARGAHPPTAGDAPLFLLGAPRSGTSLLYKVLCLHPDVAYISNWVRRFPRQPWLGALNRLARRLPHTQRSVWFGHDSNAYVYASRRALLKRLFPQPVEGEPVYAACGIPDFVPSGAAPSEQQRDALRAAFRAIRRYAGGTRIVNKRIGNNLRIPLLEAAFPEARFVDIMRDGRAVAYSLSHVDWWDDTVVWWYGGTPRRWREEGRDPWELCARVWLEELRAIDAGLESVPAGQVLRVHYEQLVREPLPTLRVIAEFAGLRPHPAWASRLATLRFPDRNERWREGLEPGAVAHITAIQEERLRRHGYAL
jgi:hypothetical protein